MLWKRYTISEPSGHDATKVPSGIVDRGEDSTMLWVHQLSDQQWSRTMRNSNSEADQETSSDEHLDIGTDRLQHDSNDHNYASGNHTRAPTENIRDVGCNWESNDGADGHDSVEKSSSGRAWIVKCWILLMGQRSGRGRQTISPLSQSLETVHHGSIISIGSRSEHCKHQAYVQAPHSRVSVPCYSRELPSSNLEGVL